MDCFLGQGRRRLRSWNGSGIPWSSPGSRRASCWRTSPRSAIHELGAGSTHLERLQELPLQCCLVPRNQHEDVTQGLAEPTNTTAVSGLDLTREMTAEDRHEGPPDVLVRC